MNTVRIERPWLQEDAGRRRLEIPRPMIVVASACAVFACFFAIGRATDTGSVSTVESLPIASVSAPVPASLSTAPPLALASVTAGHAQPSPQRQSSSSITASPPRQALAADVSRASLSSPSPAPAASQPAAETQAPPSAPTSAPTVSSSPAQAPASHPSPAPAPTSGSSGGGGGSSPSASGGGSFDSSG